MTHSLAILALLAPASHAVSALVGTLNGGVNPLLTKRLTAIASWLSLMTVTAVAVAVALAGPLTTPVVGWGPFTLSLTLDPLSVAMLALVAFLGAVVLRYSWNYLEGDDRHGAFLGSLSLTIAAVMLLVTSGTLLQLTAMWIATSLALHRLLVFYAHRARAQVAARKKFVVARLGDATLMIAAALIYRAFGTGDLVAISERAASLDGAGASTALHLAAFLLVLTASLKSAQFPTHGWLAEVMETPTPVSALLHAGILNGGIFLIARLAPVALLSIPAQNAMVVIGGLTALLASVVMVTQNSVKVSLAYSSAAHMGFMLLLCGLGAYPIAIMHLVAHSCYKAHAFLSSGSVVDTARTSQVPEGTVGIRASTIGLVAILSAATVVLIGSSFGVSILHRPVSFALAAMLAVALMQLIGPSLAGRPSMGVLLRGMGAAAGTSVAFFALERMAGLLLEGALPTTPRADGSAVLLAAVALMAYGATAVVQLLLPAVAASSRWTTAYVHIRNGFYANAWFDRLVGALRPLGTPIASTEHAS